MKNLFYSQRDGFLFWISYCGWTDTENVLEKIKRLGEGALEFVRETKVTEIDVCVFIVGSSSRKFNKCSVFYCKTTTIPSDADVLDDKWSMMEWINY